MGHAAVAPNDAGGLTPAPGSFAPGAVALLALMAIKGVGFRTLAGMLADGCSAEALLAISEKAEALEQLRRFGARVEGGDGVDWNAVRERALEKATRQAQQFADQGITLLLRHDPRFPKKLLDLPSPPHWLFVQGSVQVLHGPAITAVGTREPSEDGKWLSAFVGAQFSDFNVATVSGLALGVDQLVHQWSLRAGVPTVAVLGTGILSDYPKGAAELRGRIIENGGALITEYLPRETYSAENFVKRNRLQAALGDVLIPVEWNARSGTAHTVRFATALRRPLACLRLPDWPEGRVVLSKGCGLETGRLFTVPGQEADFRDYVRGSVRTKREAPAELEIKGAAPMEAPVDRPVPGAATNTEVQPSLFGSP